MVMTAMWLTGKDVLPDSLNEWINNHGNATVNTGGLTKVCKDFEASEVDFSNIDFNDVDDQDGLKDKIGKKVVYDSSNKLKNNLQTLQLTNSK